RAPAESSRRPAAGNVDPRRAGRWTPANPPAATHGERGALVLRRGFGSGGGLRVGRVYLAQCRGLAGWPGGYAGLESDGVHHDTRGDRRDALWNGPRASGSAYIRGRYPRARQRRTYAAAQRAGLRTGRARPGAADRLGADDRESQTPAARGHGIRW